MYKLMLIIITAFVIFTNDVSAQSSSDAELNRLWNQAEFWEKAGNTQKIAEYKEKLVDLYRKYYWAELPIMLRNIANTYGTLSEPYWSKSDEYFKEALTIISQRSKSDENLTLYYNCLGDMVGFNFERKNYIILLNIIKVYSNYLNNPIGKTHKEEFENVRKWKYNTIQILNDSCQQLLKSNKPDIAYSIMTTYVSEFIQLMHEDNLISDISNLCLTTVWQYAEILKNVKKSNEYIDLLELATLFFRKHIDFYVKNGTPREYLWSLERFLANEYSAIGNYQRDIELSTRIVEEVRETEDSLLLSEKLVDLGVSYEKNHTIEGREKSQKYFEESLALLSKLSNSQDKQNITLMALDFLASEYVLCSQYEKAVALFESYESFLNNIRNRKDNALLINVLKWKSSTFQHLDFSIPGSRKEAQKINSEVLEYERRTYGELSIQHLSQLRTCTFAYEENDTAELSELYDYCYCLWQQMPQREVQPDYASFLASFLSFKYIHDTPSSCKKMEEELDSLCLTSYINYHTKINYLINRSVNEYNNCQYESALEHIEKAQNECEIHMEDSEMLEKMANIYNHKSQITFCMGQYGTAKEFAYTAYEYIEKYKYDNLLKSNILYSLSYLMDNFGEKEESINMSIKAFNTYYKCKGNSTPLDVVCSTINRFDPKSQINLIDTLHIENFFDNPQVVDLYITKASAFISLGNVESADSCLLQAEKYIDIYKNDPFYKNANRYNLVMSQILFNRGVLAYWRNDYNNAISFLKDYRRVLNSDEPLPWLNTLYALVKDSTNFKIETKKSLDYIRREISERFVYLSDHERELYMTNKLSSAINEIEAYASLYPELGYARSAAFDAVLLEKGLALSASSKIQKIMDNSSVDTRYLTSLRNQLSMASNKESRSSLQLKISLEEQKLQSHLGPKIKDYLNLLLVDHREIKKQVNSQSAVIEFIKVFNSTNSANTYGALILTKELDSPIYVNIGTEGQLETLKKDHLIYSNENHDVFNLLWEPLMPYIKEKKFVYFVPTGVLHLLNIELIAHNYEKDKTFVRLSSSRELCDIISKSHIRNNVVLFGGLCYDCESQDGRSSTQERVYLESTNDSITRAGISFLPGSLDEINNISKIATVNKLRSTVYSGKNGSELNYKSLAGGEIAILHLSTHGFSLGHKTISEYGDPMRRCGLLLSSSQQAWNGEINPNVEDGILLGEEIANVNINNNDLVVLSACESALGVTTAEGVWGLQRSFKKAGSNSILMSLWKVNDYSTKLLMMEFYKNYLSGISKHESLRKAQKYVREFKSDDGDELFKDPSYWAAWILLDALD